MPTLFASSEKKCSMNQGCPKRFYRHMFFQIIYFFTFETSATASCGYMLYIYIYLVQTVISTPSSDVRPCKLTFVETLYHWNYANYVSIFSILNIHTRLFGSMAKSSLGLGCFKRTAIGLSLTVFIFSTQSAEKSTRQDVEALPA